MARRRRRNPPGTGSFRRRPSGSWEGSLEVGPRNARTRITVTAPTQREARELLAAKAAAHVHPDARQTVGEYLTWWLRVEVAGQVKEGRITAATRRNYRQAAERLEVLHPVGLGDLSPEHVARALRQLLDSHAPSTVALTHRVLKVALGHAVRTGVLERNAAAAVDGPRLPRREPDPPSLEECRALLAAAAGTRLEALWHVILALGLRIGEALALRWDDVDLKGRRVIVRANVGRIDGQLIWGDTKGHKTAVLPLAGFAVDALRDHLERQDLERMVAGRAWQDHGLVFCRGDGEVLSASTVRRELERLCAAAGVRRLTPHQLRSAAGTVLVEAGVPIEVVMEVLRHSSVELTKRAYVRIRERLTREAAEAMDRAFGGLQ